MTTEHIRKDRDILLAQSTRAFSALCGLSHAYMQLEFGTQTCLNPVRASGAR
jgi:hypothetical protein